MARPSVLILCTGNSARSQMAEGILRHYVGDRFDVHSAGTHPSIVRPEAIAAMAEWGEDLSSHRSKSVEEFAARNIDYVITVCDNAASNCPVFPGETRRLHWRFEDPAAGTMDDFRRVRDQIARRFRAFPPPTYRSAVDGDRVAVDALLHAAALVPIDELSQFGGSQWVVATNDTGQVLGVAGIEMHGGDGLLRSVAVAPELRMAGIGGELVRNRIDWAKRKGLDALYLLTTTAADYWPRFGFVPTARSAAPADIARSNEWSSACPATAAAMRLELR